MSGTGWIGVDLDGTLAYYDRWRGHTYIGPAIDSMVERIKNWIVQGIEVRIFTARVSSNDDIENQEVRQAIAIWLAQYGLPSDLKVTNVKDYAMIELWDDRAVHVVHNTGEPWGSSRIDRKTYYPNESDLDRRIRKILKK